VRRFVTPAVIGYLFLLAGVGFLATELHNQQQQLSAISTSQVNNRVSNVATWCNGINDTRDEARLQSAATNGRTYKLLDLNCSELESNTAKSAVVK
jgi:hypothetical protein